MARKVLRRLSLSELVIAVVDHVSTITHAKCVTDPDNEESPFYSIGAISSEPGRSKTMYLEVFTVELHVISKPSKTRYEIFEMIRSLQEAMSTPISLEKEGLATATPYTVVRQVDNGVQTIKHDETGEWHAIVSFEVTVSYGLMIK